MFNANNISVSWPRDSDSRRQIVRSDEILSHIWFSFYYRTLSNVQRQLSTWSNALQSVAKNLDVLLYYSILGRADRNFSATLQLSVWTVGSKQEFSWLMWTQALIHRFPTTDWKAFKMPKTNTIGYEALLYKEEAVCLFYNYLFSCVVSRFSSV